MDSFTATVTICSKAFCSECLCRLDLYIAIVSTADFSLVSAIVFPWTELLFSWLYLHQALIECTTAKATSEPLDRLLCLRLLTIVLLDMHLDRIGSAFYVFLGPEEGGEIETIIGAVGRFEAWRRGDPGMQYVPRISSGRNVGEVLGAQAAVELLPASLVVELALLFVVGALNHCTLLTSVPAHIDRLLGWLVEAGEAVDPRR